MSEIVPFNEAKVEVQENVTITDGIHVELSGGRSVEVWRVKDGSGFAVRIFRPTDDGKVSKLLFGLNHDAAAALFVCLRDALKNVSEQPDREQEERK